MQNRLRVFLQKHAASLVWGSAILFLFLHPDSRPWLMQRLFDVGLFAAKMEGGSVHHNPAPPVLNLVDDAGKPLSLAAFQDKVVVLNFWAPWCPPCRGEMPSLQALYKKLENDPRIKILLVDMEGDKAKANLFLHQKQITIPNYSVIGPVDTSLFSGSLPTTVVLAPGGKQVWKHEGLANYNTPEFQAQLVRLATPAR